MGFLDNEKAVAVDAIKTHHAWDNGHDHLTMRRRWSIIVEYTTVGTFLLNLVDA